MPSTLKTHRHNKPSPAISIESLEQRAYCSVDLTGSVSVIPSAKPIKPGGHIVLLVTLSNIGTTTAIGKVQTALSLSGSADGSAPIPLGTPMKHIHLLPGADTSFHVTEKIPVGFTPGTYYPVADIDPADSFAESNLANNVVVDTSIVTIDSLYRDIVGTWVGTAVIKKGVDKGLSLQQTIINTSEDLTTGIVSFTGTNTFPGGAMISFAGTTTLKPNGTYTVVATDVPADSSGTIMDKAKLVGNTGIGHFVTAVNSGTFSDTLVTPV